MKNIIDYVLGKTFYAKQLSKLEYSLTFYAFFNSDTEADKEKKIKDDLKSLEKTFDKLPPALKIQRISHINRYIDSTTTDEPMLYSSYRATNTCYNIIIKTYLLNIFQKEKLNKNVKNKLITYVKENTNNQELGDLSKTIEFLKLDNLLEEKPHTQKSRKI
jgi:hypothetical protein